MSILPIAVVECPKFDLQIWTDHSSYHATKDFTIIEIDDKTHVFFTHVFFFLFFFVHIFLEYRLIKKTRFLKF